MRQGKYWYFPYQTGKILVYSPQEQVFDRQIVYFKHGIYYLFGSICMKSDNMMKKTKKESHRHNKKQGHQQEQGIQSSSLCGRLTTASATSKEASATLKEASATLKEASATLKEALAILIREGAWTLENYTTNRVRGGDIG
jgi:hypothetical protein